MRAVCEPASFVYIRPHDGLFRDASVDARCGIQLLLHIFSPSDGHIASQEGLASEAEALINLLLTEPD